MIPVIIYLMLSHFPNSWAEFPSVYHKTAYPAWRRLLSIFLDLITSDNTGKP